MTNDNPTTVLVLTDAHGEIGGVLLATDTEEREIAELVTDVYDVERLTIEQASDFIADWRESG